MANTSKGMLFLPPSDAYVRSFLYLLDTLIKLYCTKPRSNQASSLAPGWILLWRPRIPASLQDSASNNVSSPMSIPFPDKLMFPSLACFPCKDLLLSNKLYVLVFTSLIGYLPSRNVNSKNSELFICFGLCYFSSI